SRVGYQTLAAHVGFYGGKHGGANALSPGRSLLGRTSRQGSDRGGRCGREPDHDRFGAHANVGCGNDHAHLARGRTKRSAPGRVVFNQSFMMSILVALALGVCGFALMNPYCNSLSADAMTAALAKSYLLWFIPA